MAIDFKKLLKDSRLQKKVSKKRYTEYLENEDALNKAISDSKAVLTVGWESNFPGGSGIHWIRCWKGFYFFKSTDFDHEGPFDTLEEALDLDCFDHGISDPTIDCDALPLHKLKSIAKRLATEDWNTIVINNTPYERKGEQLVKATE